MNESKASRKTVILVIAVLILAGISVAVFMSSNGDDSAPQPEPASPTAPADETPETPAPPESETNPAAASIQALLDRGRALETEFDQTIAAGCGDDIDAFNQEVIDLVIRFGSYQNSVVDEFAGGPGQIPAEVASSLAELQALVESVESKHDSLAELSNNCNSQ